MSTAHASEQESTSLQVGRLAPDFTLSDQSGTSHHLTAYRGQWVLVYFYPKVKPEEHTDEILKALAQFGANG